MKKLLIGIVLVVVLGIGWYLLSPLAIDRMVDEAFPGSAETGDAGIGTAEEETATDAEAQSTGPVVLREGAFIDIDIVHKGSGTARIYETADGVRILRFENFEVTNGPGLHVLLSAHSNPRTQAEVKGGGYLDLGGLKGNVGNQNYALPGDIDLSLYKSIVIYCYPFNVVFSTATLD